jgi:error-prone DNA polymerase
VQDAKRHGVRVLGVDIQQSQAQSILVTELETDSVTDLVTDLVTDFVTESASVRYPVRLGLDRIRSLTQGAIQRIIRTRETDGPFQSVEDLALRAALDQHDLRALAASGSLKSIAGHRHQAVWQATGQERMPALLQTTRINEPAVTLSTPSEGENLVADYSSLGLSLERHPLSLLRSQLQPMGVRTARELQSLPHGRLARAAGLVTHRQRPGTANGTIFISLEDDTGMVNVIVWPRLMENFEREILYSQLMLVYGVWQRDTTIDPASPGQVRHLLAQRVEDQTHLLKSLLGTLATTSRDFH